MEFTAVFAPDGDAAFAAAPFLEVTGRARRLPLALAGTGIGPKLTFSYDVVDVGEASGTVEGVTLRATRFATCDDDHHMWHLRVGLYRGQV